jgi:hypothetical protein
VCDTLPGCCRTDGRVWGAAACEVVAGSFGGVRETLRVGVAGCAGCSCCRWPLRPGRAWTACVFGALQHPVRAFAVCTFSFLAASLSWINETGSCCPLKPPLHTFSHLLGGRYPSTSRKGAAHAAHAGSWTHPHTTEHTPHTQPAGYLSPHTRLVLGGAHTGVMATSLGGLPTAQQRPGSDPGGLRAPGAALRPRRRVAAGVLAPHKQPGQPASTTHQQRAPVPEPPTSSPGWFNSLRLPWPSQQAATDSAVAFTAPRTQQVSVAGLERRVIAASDRPGQHVCQLRAWGTAPRPSISKSPADAL